MDSAVRVHAIKVRSAAMTVRLTARSVFVCAAEADAVDGGGAWLGIDGRRDEELM
jgi:hypothetical protein